ncbi:MAG: hypothetical protein IPM21_03910 [Acidobacteria bacterium]|nr:hypothetical protein [Acidobacteriota bacterium]
MKTIIRYVGISALLAVFMAAGSSAVSAQDPCEDFDGMNALYNKVIENYGKLETLKVSVDSGKQYLEKYGNCESAKAFVDWLKPLMPQWEKDVAQYELDQKLSPLFRKYDAAVGGQNKNWVEAFAAAKEIQAIAPSDPRILNVIIPLGQAALFEAAPPKKNNAFNSDSLMMADKALSMLRSGTAATKKNKAGQDAFGVFEFEGTKEQVIADLTYAKAYVKFYGQGDKKAGLVDYFELTQMPVGKSNPAVYGAIGDYYFEEVTKLADQVKEMIVARNALTTDEEKIAKDTEIAAKEGLLKATAERGVDAYARAYKNTKADAASKAYRDGLYNNVKTLYNVRFEKETGVDEFIASTIQKPMPNPTSEVTPVVIESPTAADTSTDTASGN